MPPLPVIHLSRDMAGLIAQVYPTLVIALLLEGRLRSTTRHLAVQIIVLLFHTIRLTTIIGALYIVVVCLTLASLPPGADAPPLWLEVINTVVLWLVVLMVGISAAVIWFRQNLEDVMATEPQGRERQGRGRHTKDDVPPDR